MDEHHTFNNIIFSHHITLYEKKAPTALKGAKKNRNKKMEKNKQERKWKLRKEASKICIFLVSQRKESH